MAATHHHLLLLLLSLLLVAPISSQAPADKPDKTACATLHLRDECLALRPKDGCIWCQNKFSPEPGSDGVCVAENDAEELPSWTYDCKGRREQPVHAKKVQARAQGGKSGPAGGGGGGDDPCPKLRKRKQCTPEACVWCKNKYAGGGNDGVCVDESQASYLPAQTYECKRVKPSLLAVV